MAHAHNYHEKTAKETEEILIRKSSLESFTLILIGYGNLYGIA